MKKLGLAIGVFFLMTNVVANASEVRLTTLGENYTVMKDVYNIWEFPSTLMAYPNVAVGEINDGNFERLGMHWQLGSWIMAGYFNTTSHYLPLGGRGVDQRIDFFAGTEMAGLGFGGRMSFWGEGDSREDGEQYWGGFDYDGSNFSDTFSRFEISLGATAFDGKADFSIQFGFDSWNNERNRVDLIGLNESPADTSFTAYDARTSDGDLDFDISGRYFHEFSSQWTLVPHFSLSSGKSGRIDQNWYGLDSDGNSSIDQYKLYKSYEYESNSSDLTIGVGTNYQTSQNVMTVTDIGLQFTSRSSESIGYTAPNYTDGDGSQGTKTSRSFYESTPTYIPYFKIGLDADVRDWLDLRLGAVSKWFSTDYVHEFNGYNYTEPDESETSYGVNTEIYLGAGFHWGDLEIDALLQPAFLNNGPDFITGNSTDGWAGQVALVYNFGVK